MPYPVAAARGGHSVKAAAGGPAAASGYFQFMANPSDGDPLPGLNGNDDFIFELNPSTNRSITIGNDLVTTLLNLAERVSDLRFDVPELTGYTYTTDGVDKFVITADTPGSAGNAYTLGASTANIIRSGPTLTGGAD